MYNYVQIIVQEVRKVQTRRLHMESKKGIVGTTVAQKSVPMLCHFEKIRELWDIKKESGKALAGWMEVLALGIPKLLWSCDLVAMEARYRHFKMICYWDTYLTLYYNRDFSTLYALSLLVSLPQVF